MSKLRFAEGSQPDTPPSGKLFVWVDNADGHLKQIDDAGAVLDLTEGNQSAGDFSHGSLADLSTGTDHSYIDQDVTVDSSPTFDGDNFTGIDANDIDIADAGSLITATNAEAALQENRAAINLRVSKDSDTGAAVLPVGTTGQRTVSPSAGYIRFNSDETTFEGYDGSEWGDIGGGGSGLPQLMPDNMSLDDTDIEVARGSAFSMIETIDYGSTSDDGSAWITFNFPSSLDAGTDIDLDIYYHLSGSDNSKVVVFKTEY